MGGERPGEASGAMTQSLLPDTQRWLDEHGDSLYRFALLRVRNQSVAEDLVQETLLAALQGSRRESGPTAERRWMIGIMKHKIVDYFRAAARESPRDDARLDGRSTDEDFSEDGHWRPEAARLRSWPDKPDGLLERKQFWDALTTCLQRLPPRMAQVFSLREVDELDTEDICRLLGVTQTNLGVLLHRARKQLRACLTSRYFGRNEEAARS